MRHANVDTEVFDFPFINSGQKIDIVELSVVENGASTTCNKTEGKDEHLHSSSESQFEEDEPKSSIKNEAKRAHKEAVFEGIFTNIFVVGAAEP